MATFDLLLFFYYKGLQKNAFINYNQNMSHKPNKYLGYNEVFFQFKMPF